MIIMMVHKMIKIMVHKMIMIKMLMMVPQVVHISQDSFYRELKGADRFLSILQIDDEDGNKRPRTLSVVVKY